MIAWPSTLPQVPHASVQITPLAGVSSPDDLLSPSRTRTYPEFQGVFTFRALTLAQQQTLRNFFDVDVNQTAAWSAPWLPLCGLSHHFCQFSVEAPLKWSGTQRGRATATITVSIIAGVPVDGTGAITYGAEG